MSGCSCCSPEVRRGYGSQVPITDATVNDIWLGQVGEVTGLIRETELRQGSSYYTDMNAFINDAELQVRSIPPWVRSAGSRRLCIQLRAAQSFLHSFANIGRARWGAELAAQAAGAGLVHKMVAQSTKMIARL